MIVIDLITVTMPVFRSDLDPEAPKKFNEWVCAVYKRLGYNGQHGYIFIGSGNTFVFALLGEHIYRGNPRDPFLYVVGEPDVYWPGMLCKCGGVEFHIHSTEARCIHCGVVATIWEP